MDIIAAIDEATGCQYCGDLLDEGSPSGDFCSEDCQSGWHRAKVVKPRPFFGQEPQLLQSCRGSVFFRMTGTDNIPWRELGVRDVQYTTDEVELSRPAPFVVPGFYWGDSDSPLARGPLPETPINVIWQYP